jgi:hypothetical protein
MHYCDPTSAMGLGLYRASSSAGSSHGVITITSEDWMTKQGGVTADNSYPSGTMTITSIVDDLFGTKPLLCQSTCKTSESRLPFVCQRLRKALFSYLGLLTWDGGDDNSWRALLLPLDDSPLHHPDPWSQSEDRPLLLP